ncbi:ABC transporter ATP-binding protein, partial [Oleiphilus sp. HI0067]
MACLTACIAVMEVSLFRFLGELVDLLTASTPATLWEEHSSTLTGYGVIVLLVLPITVLLHSSVIHQALLGNYPMRIRWNAHRYLLGQSLGFFQDEFAGRIATKVMQTALSVREAVMKMLDVLLYVSVYFIGMVSVLAMNDPTLSIPLLLWFASYVGVLCLFIPQLRQISTLQADARSAMTGSIVDTYTNISTVKLFSHSNREADYARESMDGFLQTVYPQMRLVTKLNVSVWFLNSLLLFSVATLSIYLWSVDAVSTGAIAVAIGLALRLNGMSQWIMWEVSALFENIGSVQDGINTISQPKLIQDKNNANALAMAKGQIDFNQVSFEYNAGESVLKDLSLRIKAGEKIGLVGRSGAGKSTLINLLLRFHDIQKGEILVDGQNVSAVQQESLR